MANKLHFGGKVLRSTKADKPKASRAMPAPSRPETGKTERDWEAEEDARTIARANVIKADPDRAQRAGKAAVKLADEKRAELRGLAGIARRAR